MSEEQANQSGEPKSPQNAEPVDNAPCSSVMDNDEKDPEPQRKASLMQRTDTILERIDAEGGATESENQADTVPFVDISELSKHSDCVNEITYQDLGAVSAGYLRNRLPGDDEISDTMTSSLICTDGSDVDVLSDREISDFQDGGADNYQARMDNLALDDDYENLNTECEDNRPMHIDAVVRVENKPKVDEGQARLLLEKAESRGSSDSGSPDSDDVLDHMSASMTGAMDISQYSEVGAPEGQSDFTATCAEDLDSGAINRPDSLSLPRPLQYHERHKKLVRSESKSSSCSNYR